MYVVPQAMRKSLVMRYYDLGIHFSVNKTVNRMKNYYFPKMRRSVRVHIKNSLECLLAKQKSGNVEGELHPIPPGRRPFDVIHIDHVGPFVTTKKGNQYVLRIHDNLTNYIHIEAVKNTTVAITVKKVREFILRFGAPNRIISVRGTCFTAKQVWCKTHKRFCLRCETH